MPNTSLYFPPWNNTLTYSQFDVAYGITTPVYYYSTQDRNQGNSPSGNFIYAVTGYTRFNDVTTLLLARTGSATPPFAPGSMIAVTGVGVNTSVNYTGMIIGGTSNSVSYLNPGWPDSAGASTGALNTVVNPAWSTGCFFIPAYSTNVEIQQNTINAAFEPGYEQRQAASINSNIPTWNLFFQNRSNKEARAIRNFFEDKGGVYAFEMPIPVSELDNQPNQKFIGGGPRITTNSFGLNDVSVTVRRVFDP